MKHDNLGKQYIVHNNVIAQERVCPRTFLKSLTLYFVVIEGLNISVILTVNSLFQQGNVDLYPSPQLLYFVDMVLW